MSISSIVMQFQRESELKGSFRWMLVIIISKSKAECPLALYTTLLGIKDTSDHFNKFFHLKGYP